MQEEASECGRSDARPVAASCTAVRLSRSYRRAFDADDGCRGQERGRVRGTATDQQPFDEARRGDGAAHADREADSTMRNPSPSTSTRSSRRRRATCCSRYNTLQ